jgi:Flp pilus assembly protein TadD
MNPLSEEKMEAAHMALAIGEMGEAAALYRTATEIDPANSEAWQALGMALVKLGELEEAIRSLEQLVALKPKDQLAYTSLSLAYGRAGRIQEAEEMAGKAKVAAWGGDPTRISKPS